MYVYGISNSFIIIYKISCTHFSAHKSKNTTLQQTTTKSGTSGACHSEVGESVTLSQLGKMYVIKIILKNKKKNSDLFYIWHWHISL